MWVSLPPTRASRRSAGRKRRRGAVYARFSTRFQHSIQDQVRICRDWAAKNDVDLDERHIFTDEAETGKTHRRKGLNSLLAALRADEIDVVITFATNRIYRKMYRSLQFVEEEIIDRRKRCVFVAQNIDTEKTDFWRNLMQVFSMLDEVQVQLLRGQVRAAHEGLLLKKLVHSTVSFGYAGTPVPGEFTKLGKPRRTWVIDPDTAKWVTQAFRWFVDDELKYSQIGRKLREANVPPPPRVSRWTWRAVKYLLGNRRYIGDWSYGWKEAVWQNKAGYSRQFQREEPHLTHRIEELRIVPDDLFVAAQQIAAKHKGHGGRKRKGQENAPPHLLKGLLWCETHQHDLSVCGAYGQRLACPVCKADPQAASLYSMVNRSLAERILCDTLAKHIMEDADLVQQIIGATQRQATTMQTPTAQELDGLEKELKRSTNRIGFIMDNPGETETDRRENSRRLRELRAERAGIESEIAQLQAAAGRQIEVPNEQQVRQMLKDLADTFVNAGNSEDPQVVAKARSILFALTGGKIIMSQQGEAKHHRGWLRGTFKLQVLKTMIERLGGGSISEDGQEITLDFRDPCEAERLADEVKALFDQGMLIKQIAKQLGISRNLATAALNHWFESRGMEAPDGRTRRSQLEVKHVMPPLYQRISDDVMRLCDQQMLLHEIARQLNCDRNTVTQAIQYWYESRGLEAPDGRARRKDLAIKSSKPRQGTAPTDEAPGSVT